MQQKIITITKSIKPFNSEFKGIEVDEEVKSLTKDWTIKQISTACLSDYGKFNGEIGFTYTLTLLLEKD